MKKSRKIVPYEVLEKKIEENTIDFFSGADAFKIVVKRQEEIDNKKVIEIEKNLSPDKEKFDRIIFLEKWGDEVSKEQMEAYKRTYYLRCPEIKTITEFVELIEQNR